MDNGTYVTLSSTGYYFLEHYTKALYGERGCFRHNLERYVCSDLFQQCCRMPKSVEEIPEIKFDNIKAQITREEFFKETADHVVNEYTKRINDDSLTKDDELEIAGIMGLCPGHCEWYDTLFPHVVDLFISSNKEGNEIWNNIMKQRNIVSVMVMAMINGIRNGQVIDYCGRELFFQGYSRNLFRGENAYNVQGKPSMYRNIPSNSDDAEIQRVICYLRIMEFSIWIKSLSFVQQWRFGDVFCGAIAQHYGIPTSAMDITSDIKAALFFASCQCDKGTWRPLKPEEYQCKESRLDVARRGGDSRYGILFVAPMDISNMSMAAQLPDLHFTQGVPVGYQPFMRCVNQNAYIIEAASSYDIYQDPSFNKYKFRLTPEICEWIFEEMDRGEAIYPNEIFGTCEDVVATVMQSECFSECVFNGAMRHLNLLPDSDNIRKHLEQRGVHIMPTVDICSEDRKKEIENTFFESYPDSIYQSMMAYFNPIMAI